MNLDKLIDVPLRSGFPGGASEFNRWLAQDENLEQLGSTMDMDLDLRGVDVPVGPYSADLVADEAGEKILIQTQFSLTTPDYLGKLITYAAGIRCQAVIWIAEQFTEEHRRAVDFLNEVTSEQFRLYAVEIRLVRVGDSPPAAQFRLVARPNIYLRAVARSRGARPLSDTERLYLEFWTTWRQFVGGQRTKLSPRTPLPQYYTTLPLGRSECSILLTASARHAFLRCEIYLGGPSANAAFQVLKLQQDEIEKITGDLDWKPLRDKQACRIAQIRDEIDISDRERWPQAHAWLLERAEVFNKAFRNRVKKLDIPVDEDSTTRRGRRR